MSLLPIMLKLEGKRAAIVGAGKVAARHIPKLLEAGIKEVVVYAPTLHPILEGYQDHLSFTWVKEVVQFNSTFNEELLFLMTDDKTLHRNLYRRKKSFQLIYVANDANLSDFHFPMTMQKGKFSFSLSTGGASPTYGKKIMKEIELALPDTIDEDLVFLEKARKLVLKSNLSQKDRRLLLQNCASAEWLQDPDRDQKVMKWIEEITSGGSTRT
ncbi:bifunctional precorrin-2 dehydrogenase/sirohydrochlorin ferrochelatase [Alkalihalobacillus sp. MEB130]|uniref:precorrin-2 dehydrogenase/sirohydrochlorin ferrochelatase family protein n=1 Tax=Alkalihalobacillus sp. MEB130 TaxID=2976704 RepID=UPI0028DF0E8C|nr:bifunctional precorrin-2 dehydrogenase/sirohydrochlorin ferrochelatase [Alkalihalobacillus sp. MEB130]MDT8859878.1 bifunctional precorrin-2 dehydrogenase/sirohydrochlorin ferrochelatase [Alkalihalobacillus sp. MEB130]